MSNPYDLLPEPVEDNAGGEDKRKATTTGNDGEGKDDKRCGTKRRRVAEAATGKKTPADGQEDKKKDTNAGKGDGGAGNGAETAKADGGSDGEAACEQGEEAARAKRAAVLTKLQSVLQSDNQQKYLKALSILQKMVESELSADTARDFVSVLRVVQTPSIRVHRDWARRPVTQLFETIASHRDDFIKDTQFEVDTWVLRCVSHNGLYTDDTYRFAKHSRPLRAALEALDHPNSSEDAMNERRAVLLDALETMLAFVKHSWAKVPVDGAFKDATDRRLLFPDAQRDRLDALFAQAKAARTAAALSKGVPGAGGWHNWSS